MKFEIDSYGFSVNDMVEGMNWEKKSSGEKVGSSLEQSIYGNVLTLEIMF